MKTLLATLALSLLAATALHAQAPYWEQLAGPYGGMIKTLVIDSSGTLYAGSWQGGIYRSTDSGATWRTSDTFTLGFRIGGMAAAPNGHLFLATSGSYNNVTEPVRRIGFYRSTDHGDSWQLTTPAKPNIYPTAAAVAPNGDVYMGSFDGIFRSTDEGVTWKALGGVGTSDFITSLYVARDGRVFYTTSARAASGNFGSITPSGESRLYKLSETPQNIITVMVDARGRIFVGTSDGLYRSSDSGATWTTLKLRETPLNQGPYALAVDSGGRLYAGMPSNGIFISSDDGVSWTNDNDGIFHRDVRLLLVNRDGVVFAGSWGDGVYRSQDRGAHWIWSSNGMRNVAIRSFALAPNGHLFAGTYAAGLYRSIDGGASWQRLPRRLEFVTSVVARPDGSIVSGGPYSYWGDPSPQISTDDGETWRPLMRGAPGGSAMAYNAAGDLFFANGDNLYRKRAGDTTFKQMVKSSSISGLAIDSLGRIYLATNGDGVYSSSDNGETWAHKTGRYMHGVAAGREEAYALETAVTRSTDGGATWRTLGQPYDNLAYGISVDRNGHLYIGSFRNGVLHSADHGATWDTLSSGLTATEFRAFGYDAEGRVLAGSESGGIFRSLAPSSSVPGDPIAERLYSPLASLAPGYPNPTSSSLMLGYSLPSGGRVSIELYDMRGAFIRTLLDEERPVGHHQIAVDVSDLPAGAYTCRLRAGTSAAARMIVVGR